jgi:ornithine--oxo-acid transaminase
MARPRLLSVEGNFHGRTTTIVGFSSEPSYKRNFGPFTPGFVMIPYGDTAALEAAITPNTVGFLVEPIQGEGGVIMPHVKASQRGVRHLPGSQRVVYSR